MWHHVEGIQEAAVVQDPRVHVVGHRVILVPTERQGHGGAGTLPGGGRPEEEEEGGRPPETERQRGLNKGPQSISPWFQQPIPFVIQLPNFGFREQTEGERGGRTEEAGRGQRQSQSGAAAAPALPRHSKRLSGPCW